MRHENDQVQRVEMRGGEGVGLPGYDGVVQAGRATPFVPEGLSVWEMGTSEDPAGKATDDYKTRTADPLGIEKSTTTFVFVTPRRWRKKKDWEQKRRKEGVWADVRVLDADDIEQALEESAAVRVWLSELLGMPAHDVATIEDWWRRFSNTFDPRLTEAIVLAGREDQAALLLRRLSVDVGSTLIKAASVDDGLAFAACAMMAQAKDASEPMLSRSLLVHESIALRRLDGSTSLLILLPYEEHLYREAQLVENHHVVFIITDGDAHIELPSLEHRALQEALRHAGVLEADLPRFSRAGNKSLLALRRVATKFALPDPEQWSSDLSDRIVRRAWLAGAWSRLRSGDVEVLEGLTEGPRDLLEERLDLVIRQPDPLFTRVGATWAVAAPGESWRSARYAVKDIDLVRLELAVQTVLGSIDPRLELPVSERWRAAIHGKSRVHSTDLRRGLARSIALLGARGDDIRLPGGRTARQWAERVVWNLLGRANEDGSADLWVSIEDVMPSLAEAAPDVFLRAVAQGATGARPILRALFQDHDSEWSAGSPHTGLLWALEGVAWSNQHVGYAAELLAQLAEIDPGGRLSNRPAASLRDIFRPWHPRTSAPNDTRIKTIDAMLLRHREVVWRLLLDLLPGPSEVGMETHKPHFREWAADSDRSVTYSELSDMVDALSERVIRLAKQEPTRWIEVVPLFDRMPNRWRLELISALGELDHKEIAPDARARLWDAIEEFVRRHRRHPQAKWSLTEQWLDPLAAIAERFRPARDKDVYRWLFDDWTPDIGVSVREDFGAYQRAVKQARESAITQVLEDEGFAGVTSLASTVELPQAVGSALAYITLSHDYEALSHLDNENERLARFGEGFARVRGEGDLAKIRPWMERFAGRPLTQARLLQTVINPAEAWNLLSTLDTEVDDAYWKEFLPYGHGADFADISEAARQLILHGRTAAAVDALSMYADTNEVSVEVDVVIQALERFGTTEDPEVSRVSGHDLARLLEFLRVRRVDEDKVATLEWKYLPALQFDTRTPSLERLISRDPGSFVQLVELAFKPANSTSSDVPRVAQDLATKAYRLLHDWQTIPGTQEDGVVNADALREWLDQARSLLVASDRLEVGELQIGGVFAHSPEDPDGTFPTLAVREILETASSDRLERGFTIGLYNKRGVTWRGLTDGGVQEYDLAETYDQWAEAIQASHPRTASALRSVAESYREDGRRNDEEARRFLEGLDG
ncbi:hypothetical protein [Actinoplanes sp. DH11]|uniref:hypothetical protein n=1 Tax=Actinoplanes sp. DH11 TaxID=2857011 RepID=UPI001E492E2E|nr:hypothetical protein [Actinoplanes sp. DH11]